MHSPIDLKILPLNVNHTTRSSQGCLPFQNLLSCRLWKHHIRQSRSWNLTPRLYTSTPSYSLRGGILISYRHDPKTFSRSVLVSWQRKQEPDCAAHLLYAQKGFLHHPAVSLSVSTLSPQWYPYMKPGWWITLFSDSLSSYWIPIGPQAPSTTTEHPPNSHHYTSFRPCLSSYPNNNSLRHLGWCGICIGIHGPELSITSTMCRGRVPVKCYWTFHGKEFPWLLLHLYRTLTQPSTLIAPTMQCTVGVMCLSSAIGPSVGKSLRLCSGDGGDMGRKRLRTMRGCDFLFLFSYITLYLTWTYLTNA